MGLKNGIKFKILQELMQETNVERPISIWKLRDHHGTGNHILYLCTNKSGAFTGLYMLELHNLEHIAVLFKGYAVSEITC